MAKNPWEKRWIKKARIGKGGQGLTYFTEAVEGDGTPYALKLLKEQRRKDRRERMYVEVASLQILEHPNIPSFADSNVANYKDIEVDLFLVTEYISGPTLQEFIDKNGPMQFNVALDLSIKLFEIVEFCHSKEVYHRDIKPDNIILYKGDYTNPFLIDFGLSFNKEAVKEETPAEEHLGNRFLYLPELQGNQGTKRDHRSDITFLCGILLFCLSAVHPTHLIDSDLTKPHRRNGIKELLDKIDKLKLDGLNRFFDIGFNLGVNDRWQSIESAKSTLADIQRLTEADEPADIFKKFEEYKRRIESRKDFQNLRNIRELFRTCEETIRKSAHKIIEQLKPNEFGTIQSGRTIDIHRQIFTNKLGITHPYDDQLIFFPKFTCYANGSELVIVGEDEGNTTELLRQPLNEEIDWKTLDKKLQEYYMSGLLSHM